MNRVPTAFQDYVDDENHANFPVSSDLVTPPDLQKFVFAKMKQTGKVELNDGEPDLNLVMDDVFLLPYALVQEMSEKGTVELT